MHIMVTHGDYIGAKGTLNQSGLWVPYLFLYFVTFVETGARLTKT